MECSILFRFILIPAIAYYDGIESKLTSHLKEDPEICTVRYDLQNGMEQDHDKNCSYVTSYFPICDTDLDIIFYDVPPYIYVLPNGTVNGVIPAIFDRILKTCCSLCTRVNLVGPFTATDSLKTTISNSSMYSALMPSLTIARTDVFFGLPYTRLMDTPGVVYLRIDRRANEFLKNVLSSISSTWPFFVMVMLLTAQGGVIIWLLEQWRSPADFPPSFFSGVMEGAWWSYVSMTTVGYGDKAPRSIQGRIFAIFWITIGISISGMFTASLSSSLTSAAMPQETKLQNLQVGFLKQIAMSYEENILYREGAEAIGFEDIGEMLEALRRNEIAGILMDLLVFKYHQNKFENSGITFEIKEDVKNSKTSIGVMFSRPSLKNWAAFLNRFLLENGDVESRLLRQAIGLTKSEFSVLNTLKCQPKQMLWDKKIWIGFLVCTLSIVCTGIAFHLVRKIVLLRRKKISMNATNEMKAKRERKSVGEKFDSLSQEIKHLQKGFSELRAELTKMQVNDENVAGFA